MLAYILVRTPKEKELVEYVKQKPFVREAHVVYGEYDVVITAEVDDLKELSELVLEDIRGRFPVERTSTLIVT